MEALMRVCICLVIILLNNFTQKFCTTNFISIKFYVHCIFKNIFCGGSELSGTPQKASDLQCSISKSSKLLTYITCAVILVRILVKLQELECEPT